MRGVHRWNGLLTCMTGVVLILSCCVLWGCEKNWCDPDCPTGIDDDDLSDDDITAADDDSTPPGDDDDASPGDDDDSCDVDGDGYSSEQCGGEDCDDNQSGVNPAADEYCCDTFDNDCNGFNNADDLACGTTLNGGVHESAFSYPVVVDDYNCVSCHDLVHSSGLDLTTADATYLNTHDVDVNDPLNPVAQKRIAPCEPEASYLWHVVNGTVAPGVDYETMPRYGTELNKHQLADLQNWILEGARLE